jgi:hypothetical protein
MERIFMGNCVAVGQLEHVVEEAVFFVPQPMPSSPRWLMAFAM